MKKEKLEFVNTSKFIDKSWNPQITGFTDNDDEITFEVDLYETVIYNWNKFIDRYPQYSGQRSFYRAFNACKKETEYESNHCY
jgi:hypothetical protein